MKKKIVLAFLLFLSVSCNLPGSTLPAFDPTAKSSLSPSLTPEPTLTPAPKPSPTPSDKPGMVVRGQVTSNGVGLAGVNIYKRFNAYPHDLIAVSDEGGYYESEFIAIPGDEMVSVEAELAGYTFDPPFYYWRHYHGSETTTCNFAATPVP
jgi:hypothetical protein